MKESIIKALLETNREGMHELVEFLRNSDYFTAPASTKYHSNFASGLVFHSLNVMGLIKEQNIRFNLGLTEESIIITGLLHDFCKIGVYNKDKVQWAKDKRNAWKSYNDYQYEDEFPLGHGEKSVIMIQKYIKLTDVEIMMIRWHMGASELNTDIRNMYSAMKKYPQILALQVADQQSTTFLEKILPSGKENIENG